MKCAKSTINTPIVIQLTQKGGPNRGSYQEALPPETLERYKAGGDTPRSRVLSRMRQTYRWPVHRPPQDPS